MPPRKNKPRGRLPPKSQPPLTEIYARPTPNTTSPYLSRVGATLYVAPNMAIFYFSLWYAAYYTRFSSAVTAAASAAAAASGSGSVVGSFGDHIITQTVHLSNLLIDTIGDPPAPPTMLPVYIVTVIVTVVTGTTLYMLIHAEKGML